VRNKLFSLCHRERKSGEEQRRGPKSSWRQPGKVVLKATHNIVGRDEFLTNKRTGKEVANLSGKSAENGNWIRSNRDGHETF
jgi:hypothetical protein